MRLVHSYSVGLRLPFWKNHNNQVRLMVRNWYCLLFCLGNYTRYTFFSMVAYSVTAASYIFNEIWLGREMDVPTGFVS
jgi:hypothetical protein